MIKEELVEIVDRIHASWNQTVDKPSQKAVYEAWWRILKDLSKQDVDRAVDHHVIHDKFMPRPGDIRRTTINTVHGWKPPTAGEAWLQFRTMADAAHTGTFSETITIHPIVKSAVTRLGGTAAYNLHTNGDRELFLSVYQTVLDETETELYAISQSDGQ
ncbi:MAG: hypothetical protein ACO395_04640 [Pontimonas sp.]